MDTESLIDDEKTEAFFEIIRQTILPNFHFGSISTWGAAENIKSNYIEVTPSYSQSILKNSIYEQEVPSGLIHYTSIETLFSIVQTKKIRLHSLSGMDDIMELNYALNFLKEVDESSDQQTQHQKDRIFCLSMCDKIVEERGQSLAMWRKYGLDGKGVGIQLKFDVSEYDNWYKHFLTRIVYEPLESHSLSKLKQEYAKFKRTLDFRCINVGEVLSAILGFHKMPIYEHENEFRLIYIADKRTFLHEKWEDDQYEIHSNYSLGSGLKYFLELPLDAPVTYEVDKAKMLGWNAIPVLRPRVSIEKVYFGYRISKSDKEQIELALMDDLPKVLFEDSTLSSAFRQ